MAGKRDLRRILDLDSDEVWEIFELALELKRQVPAKRFEPRLAHCALAMIFEKPSLRTRCTFEIAMTQMGGTAVYLGPSEIGLGKRESIHDVAKNIERWFDLAMVRTFAQSNVDELARYASIPVINALTDDTHPCQALADFLTVLEKRGRFEGFRMAYVGDGNNICHSLMALSALVGSEIRVATPKGFEPDPAILADIRRVAESTGAKILVGHDPREAVAEVEAIYTDVWASMGQEQEAEARKDSFRPYQVNAELAALARPGAFIMHDLPAHRGEEITDEMMDGPNAIVFDQAENRMHAQKAVLVWLHERRVQD